MFESAVAVAAPHAQKKILREGERPPKFLLDLTDAGEISTETE